MAETEKPDVLFDYTYNRQTGESHLSIDYHSPANRDPELHEKEHKEIVETFLTESGLIGSGNCLVRVRRGEEVKQYNVVLDTVTHKIVWQLKEQVYVGAASGTGQGGDRKITEEEKLKDRH
jgi:hypothetical protein